MPAFPYVLTTPIGREIISSELDVVGSGESHLRATLNQVSWMQAEGGSSGIASVDFLVKRESMRLKFSSGIDCARLAFSTFEYKDG
jgi:hypothetical protein